MVTHCTGSVAFLLKESSWLFVCFSRRAFVIALSLGKSSGFVDTTVHKLHYHLIVGSVGERRPMRMRCATIADGLTSEGTLSSTRVRHCSAEK